MANKHDVQLRTQLLEKLFPTVETVDNLNSDNPNRPLSARQGKVLKELIKSGGGGSGLSIEVVETLPTTGSVGILYLVPKSSYLKEENKYDEYVWIESTSKYELLGSFSTDLDINEIKSVLGDILQINVATLPDNGINNYVDTGTYRVYGERLNSKDGLPILNAANGHTVEGILRVYNSSIAGTGQNTDKVVTQILSMSNRTGGDGHIWIRTGQGSNENNLTWSTWEKLQGIFEKNTIDDISDIDTFTTNGIYSCMYIGGPTLLEGAEVHTGSTLLIIAINGYMASKLGKRPHLTQSIILNSVDDNKNYHITRSAIYDNNIWNFMPQSNIVLEHFCACDAYIGTSGANLGTSTSEARINIGTDGIDKVVICGSVYIGSNVNILDGITLSDNDNKFCIKSMLHNNSIYINKNVQFGINIEDGKHYSLKIGSDGIQLNDAVTLSSSVAIGANAIIGNSVSITNSKINDVNIINRNEGNIVIEDTILNGSCEISFGAKNTRIVFGTNDVKFYIGTKIATIQLT